MTELVRILLSSDNLALTILLLVTGLLNSLFWYILFCRWNLSALLFAAIPTLQALLFLYGTGTAQTPGYDPSSQMALGIGLSVFVAVLGPSVLFHYVSKRPFDREALHELDILKLPKFSLTRNRVFLDPGMLFGGPLATYLMIRTLRQIDANRNDPHASAAAEKYRAKGYPIFVPATRNKLILTGLVVALLAAYSLWVSLALIGELSLIPVIMSLVMIVIVALLMNPVVRGLEIHPDQVILVSLRGPSRILFKDVISFVGGHWVEANYHSAANRSKFRRTAEGIPPEFKLSGFALAELLNRALDEFRSRNSASST